MGQAMEILAIFPHVEDLIKAVEAAKKERLKIHAVYSPTPCRQIVETLEPKPSPVRFFTLLGGILGFGVGLALSLYTAAQWKFIIGGKPVVAWIPFVVVGFEFTILLAVVGNLLGMLIKSRIPRLLPPDHYDPRFTEDRFGLLLSCVRDDEESVLRLLREAGAEEVRATER